jgi:hypothetical protein
VSFSGSKREPQIAAQAYDSIRKLSFFGHWRFQVNAKTLWFGSERIAVGECASPVTDE